MEDLNTLKKISLFVNMDDQEVAGVRGIMKENFFAPGQVIIHESDDSMDFHVLMQGNVVFYTSDAMGNELILDQVGVGGHFGELSMLTGEPRIIRVRATDPVKTLTLNRQQFHDFLLGHAHAAIDVLTVLGHRLYHTDKLLRQSVSQNVNQISDQKQTLGQKVSDGFASLMGSWPFIIVQSIILTIWVVINCIAAFNHWDPYPFILLNLALSFQAAYAAPIIMMSQNRASDKDRLAAEIDHQVNMKAEIKTGLILNRLDDLERSMHYLHDQQVKMMAERSA